MPTVIEKEIPRSWISFCLCLAGLFIVRGLILLSLYPPLEGFDEHQHIGYLVYMAENKKVPEYGEAAFPTSLYGDLVSNPHSGYGWEQLKGIGARRYGDFWGRPGQPDYGAELKLYSAFYPPLYYRSFSSLFVFFKGLWGFRESVYIIRILNIVLAGCSIIFFLYPARWLLGRPQFTKPGALTVSLLPMYLIYAARVSPDAAGLLFCSMVFFALSRMEGERNLHVLSICCGLLIGIGLQFRVSVLSMLPAAILYLIFMWASGRVRVRNLILSLLCLVLPLAAAGWRYFSANLDIYGMPVPGQEGIVLARRGEGLLTILKGIEASHLYNFFIKRMIAGNLWTSGWLFIPTSTLLYRIFFCLIMAGLGGLIAVSLRRRSGRPRIGFPEIRIAFLCAAVWLMVCGGAYLHALSTIAAYRTVFYTPSYYAVPGFMPFLLFVLFCLNGYGSRLIWYAVTSGMAVTFIVTEFYSLFFIAAPAWADTENFGLMMERLSSIHPLFPGPGFLPLLMVIYVLFIILILSAAREGLYRSPTSGGAVPRPGTGL